MKFVSKSSNYMVVLKHGMAGNNITGTPPVPGLYARFRDGILETQDKDMIEMLHASQGFKDGDFIAVDEQGEEPFADSRVGMEPSHIITELKYGTPSGHKMTKETPKLPPAIKKLIQEEASKMAKELAAQMAKEMLPGMIKEVIAEASAQEKAMEESVPKSDPRKAVAAKE